MRFPRCSEQILIQIRNQILFQNQNPKIIWQHFQKKYVKNLDFRDYYVTFKIKLNTILIAKKKYEEAIYDYLLGAPRMFLFQIIPEGAMVGVDVEKENAMSVKETG